MIPTEVSKILLELSEIQHYPIDFDPKFFESVVKQINALVPDFWELIAECDRIAPNSPILHCLSITSLRLSEDADKVEQTFESRWKLWTEKFADCSPLLSLFFSLFEFLVEKKTVGEKLTSEISELCVEWILRDETNVELRRRMGSALKAVLNSTDRLDSKIGQRILSKIPETDNQMIIDVIAETVGESKFADRLSDSDIRRLHENARSLKRPPLSFLRLVAKAYALEPKTAIGRLSEQFADSKIPSAIAFQLYRLNAKSTETLNVGNRQQVDDAELLSLIADRADADTLIECYVEVEERQREAVRLRINAAIPYPRQCSSKALSQYLAYFDVDNPNDQTLLAETLQISKRRILRNPEILDSVFLHTDGLDAMLRNKSIAKIFNELTVNILQPADRFNWAETDSAIAIFHQIADYVDYNETKIHNYIASLLEQEDEDMDSVRITASKFLIRHSAQNLLPKVGQIFCKVADTELRIEILNRLLLSTEAESPNSQQIRMILDESLFAETNPIVHSKALLLTQKHFPDSDHCHHLQSVVEADERNSHSNADQMSAEEITAMIRNVRLNGECDLECISKECY